MEPKPIHLPEQDIHINIDFLLLRDIVRRKAALLAFVGLTVAGGYALRQLYSVPQQYVGECSVAMQQSNPVGLNSGLSALLGNQGGSHKYMGLLFSRMLAEKVEKRLDFKNKFGLSSKAEAYNVLRGGLRPDDGSFEGLLIIRFVMDAPPVLGRDPQNKREKVRLVVADVANAYAAALSEFYAQSSSESSNALLDIAEDERVQARENYQRATSRLRNFVDSWKGKPVEGTPQGNNFESNGPGELINLYNQVDQIDADMRATQVAQETSKKLREEQLKNSSLLPAEDALLNNARNNMTNAEVNFKRLADIYGPDNLQYKEAESALARAREVYNNQVKGVRKVQSSDQMELRKQTEIQKTRRDSLEKLIAKAQTNLFSRRDLAWRVEQLRVEQGITQQIMQAAEVKAVDVRLSTLTGKTKISVLDKALPPEISMQGNSIPVKSSAILGLLAMSLITAVEYMRQIRRRSLGALQFAASGVGLVGADLPLKNGDAHAVETHSGNGHNGNGHSEDAGGNGSAANGNGTAANGNGNGSNGSGRNGDKTEARPTKRR